MKAKNMALGGMLTSLTIVILYLTLFIPTNTLTLLTLASFMVPVALIRCDLPTAFLVYISSSLLSLFLLPLNIFMLYSLFFGCYGIIKYLAEVIDRPVFEWGLKFLFFNIVFTIGLQTLLKFINPSMLTNLETLGNKILPDIPYSTFIILWLVSQIAFAIFDYALTLLIDYYYKYFGHLKS